MYLSEDYEDIINIFNRHEVKYIVAGAFAMSKVGYSRSTYDIDLWVEKTKENAVKIYQALEEFGVVFDIKPDDFLEDNSVVQIGIEPNRIDILTDIDGVSFIDALNNAILADFNGLSAYSLCVEDLIRNKSATAREKDKLDLAQLKTLVKSSKSNIKEKTVLEENINQKKEVSLLKDFEDKLAVKGPSYSSENPPLVFKETIADFLRAIDDKNEIVYEVSKKARGEYLVFVFDKNNTSLSYYDGKASSLENGIAQANIFAQSLKEYQFLKANGLLGKGTTQNAYSTLKYGEIKNMDKVQQELMDLGYTKSNMQFPHGKQFVLDRVSNDGHPDFGKRYVEWEMQATPTVFKIAIENIVHKLEAVEKTAGVAQSLSDIKIDPNLDVEKERIDLEQKVRVASAQDYQRQK